MNNVPEMISTKDLSYLEDMMNWNVTDSKKASHFEQEVEDLDVKDMIHRVSMMHKDHVIKLLNMLKIGG